MGMLPSRTRDLPKERELMEEPSLSPVPGQPEF